MELLIIRHAIAFDRDRTRWRNDDERPLTPEGMRRARRAAAGLGKLTAPPDRLLSSPLLRARQTARILTDVAGWPSAQIAPELGLEESAQKLLTLMSQQGVERVAIVGHQPGLGQLLTICLLGSGSGALPIELKKPAVACVSFQGIVRPWRGQLRWLAQPRMLRKLRVSK